MLLGCVLSVVLLLASAPKCSAAAIVGNPGRLSPGMIFGIVRRGLMGHRAPWSLPSLLWDLPCRREKIKGQIFIALAWQSLDATLIQYSLLLTNHISKDFIQIRSHSKSPGRHEFGVGTLFDSRQALINMCHY